MAPEENDQERYEEKKIGTFIEMVKVRKLVLLREANESGQDVNIGLGTSC